MPIITIGTDQIEFPEVNGDPNWAPALIDFAQKVADRVNSAIGPYDVSRTKLAISNIASEKSNLPGLLLDPTKIRAIFIRYYIFRKSNTQEFSESGNILGIYNVTNTEWTLSTDYVGSGARARIIMSSSDENQMQIEIVDALTGTSYEGEISYSALTLEKLNIA